MIFRRLSDLPEEAVSHNAKARKQVILRKGEAYPITQVARSTIPAGECCGAHSHSDMFELFVVLAGCGTMTVNGRALELREGDSVLIEPGEMHELVAHETMLELITFAWEFDQ